MRRKIRFTKQKAKNDWTHAPVCKRGVHPHVLRLAWTGAGTGTDTGCSNTWYDGGGTVPFLSNHCISALGDWHWHWLFKHVVRWRRSCTFFCPLYFCLRGLALAVQTHVVRWKRYCTFFLSNHRISTLGDWHWHWRFKHTWYDGGTVPFVVQPSYFYL